METEEEDLCGAAVLAFHSLAELAERLGAGETVVISDGVSRLAERAAAFAANNLPRPFLHSPDPLARLAGIVDRLRELMPPAFAGDDSAYLKVRAGELAAKCRELSSNAAMRLASLLEKRQLEADAAERLAEAEEESKKELERKEEDKKNAERKAEAWEQRLDAALGLKRDRNEAMKTPSDVARDMFNLLEGQLTEEERSLRDWVKEGGSQAAWGKRRRDAGLPGSNAYVSKLRASIDRKYTQAGFAGAPFAKSKGGRPPVKRLRGEASGTAEDAELRGMLNGQAKKPTRRNSDKA